MIDPFIHSLPKLVDLTNQQHLDIILKTADEILDLKPSESDITRIESNLLNRRDVSLMGILLALKLVRSKLILKRISAPFHVSVVFAVYKEHNRIKTQKEHPHGEDFLLRKVAQLNWVQTDIPGMSWDLVIVDDGCPENSGKIAKHIIEQHDWQDQVSVLFLEEAITQDLPVIRPLKSTRDSQKGGAICYGMWYAAQDKSNANHIIVFTDADLSTHLGQIGLLTGPILTERKQVAIGSRREPDSVVIKKGKRNTRGKLFIYLWKRMLEPLSDIIDTQCGFKAFHRDILVQIIEDLLEKKFAFDIELLLKTVLLQPQGITKVPIAWIDSEEASTTTDIQPYLPMLKSIAKMYRKYIIYTRLQNTEYWKYLIHSANVIIKSLLL